MFTGLIEKIGSIVSVRKLAQGICLSINVGDIASGIKTGDSIAVNGACLTASKCTGSIIDFDVSPETISKTTLSRLQTNSRVNLERALSPDSRFGGHFVLGHVDDIGSVVSISHKGDFAEIVIKVNSALMDEIIPKGSVAVNGISLTVADVKDNTFTVALIPATLNQTTLSAAKPGELVNIETDIICKTIKKQLQSLLNKSKSTPPSAPNNPLTIEKLKEYGF